MIGLNASLSALNDAVSWIRTLLLGTMGTAVAILAVAVVGLLMLNGRVQVRRGATVIFGCFILFSAAIIADGIVGSSELANDAVTPPTVPQASYTPAVQKPVPYDPYAGASVPPQREQPIVR